MKAEMTVAFLVAVVGGVLSFMVTFLLLIRRQLTASWWPVALRLLNKSDKTMVIAVEKEGGVVFDCMVCLCEVSREDEYRKLPNCNHGIQFHANCIDAWLKNHNTCPVCRSHVPRPLWGRFNAYFSQHLLEDVLSYCNSALDKVASSLVDS